MAFFSGQFVKPVRTMRAVDSSGNDDPSKWNKADADHPVSVGWSMITAARQRLDAGMTREGASLGRDALFVAISWRLTASTGSYDDELRDGAEMIQGLRRLGLITRDGFVRLNGLLEGKSVTQLQRYAEQLIAEAVRLLRQDNVNPRRPQPNPTAPDARPMREHDRANVAFGQGRSKEPVEQRWTVSEGGTE